MQVGLVVYLEEPFRCNFIFSIAGNNGRSEIFDVLGVCREVGWKSFAAIVCRRKSLYHGHSHEMQEVVSCKRVTYSGNDCRLLAQAGLEPSPC